MVHKKNRDGKQPVVSRHGKIIVCQNHWAEEVRLAVSLVFDGQEARLAAFRARNLDHKDEAYTVEGHMAGEH